MTSDRLDDIVVPFPFTDRPITRPPLAVIVPSPGFNRTHDQSILAKITSARSEWPGDVALRDWREAGLNVHCKGRLKLFALDNDLVFRRLGTLSQSDRHAVDEALMR